MVLLDYLRLRHFHILLMYLIAGSSSSSRAFQHQFVVTSPRFANGPVSSALFSTEPIADESEATFWKAREDCWRPDVRDVEKISWGMPAKKKGTGSRGTPHRLNEEERRAFDQARRQGFLQVKGSSWRAQRRDAPLLNSYRSLMDARGRPAIVLHKLNPSSSGSDVGEDILAVDLSPLRYPDDFDIVALKVKETVAAELQIDPKEVMEESQLEEDDETVENLQSDIDNTMYETRPIYQIPPYLIHFQTTRQQGKEIGKLLASVFHTVEEKATKSNKPKGVKPGKSRRHGGYGIG